MPFLRTFAPFVAGVAQMTRSRFTFYDVTGGALWIGSVTLAGYLFGNVPWVKEHLELIIWGAILIPGPARLHRGVAGADEAGEDRLTLPVGAGSDAALACAAGPGALAGASAAG